MDKIIDECVTYIVGAERPYWQDDGGFPDDVKQYILEMIAEMKEKGFIKDVTNV